MSQEEDRITLQEEFITATPMDVETMKSPTIGENNRSKANSLFKKIIEIPKISSTELIRKVMTREPLFKNIYTSDSFTDLLPKESCEKLDSILVSGFGLKSLQQLQDALNAEMVAKGRKTETDLFPCICSEESSEKSETIPPPVPLQYSIEDRMKYLLQLEQYIEVEGEIGAAPSPKEVEEAATPAVAEHEPRSAMRGAKEYLRDHKIFQFFQFLMSHLLSAVPEDPIEYLMALLDRILLYRGGLLSPPLLYEKKHIEQLFHLMDRFGQGKVDLHQFKTAMETLGISTYNKKPITNQNNMISKEIFVEEIFSAELAMFNDLIKSQVSCTCDLTAPPPTIIDIDLKSQSTDSRTNSVDTVIFNPVASVSKFWEHHGEKQPKVYKGKFWAEFTHEKQKRDNERSELEKKRDFKDNDLFESRNEDVKEEVL